MRSCRQARTESLRESYLLAIDARARYWSCRQRRNRGFERRHTTGSGTLRAVVDNRLAARRGAEDAARFGHSRWRESRYSPAEMIARHRVNVVEVDNTVGRNTVVCGGQI